MSRWFRYYGDAINDPKVQSLPGELFKTWVNILCIASKHDGKLPPIDELRHLLRRRYDHLKRDFNELITRGLIDPIEGGFEPHNWDERQYKSDSSTPRVQKHRGRTGNVTKPFRETPPETDTESEAEKEVRGARSRAEKPPGEKSPTQELELAIDPERAIAVVEHRKKIRKPLTAHAARLLARKFASCPDPPLAADTMIANGWQGFEPAWMEGKSHGYRNGSQPHRTELQLALDEARGFARTGNQEHTAVPEDEPAGRH